MQIRSSAAAQWFELRLWVPLRFSYKKSSNKKNTKTLKLPVNNKIATHQISVMFMTMLCELIVAEREKRRWYWCKCRLRQWEAHFSCRIREKVVSCSKKKRRKNMTSLPCDEQVTQFHSLTIISLCFCISINIQSSSRKKWISSLSPGIISRFFPVASIP